MSGGTRPRDRGTILSVSLLMIAGGIVVYSLFADAPGFLVAIALFIGLAVLAGYVFERLDRSRKPSSKQARTTDYWRLPPR